MQTLAAVLEKLNEPLKIKHLDIPKLKPGQVLVKIAYTGICHTQINEMEGKKGEDKFLPHTLGHEASGVVNEVGEGVTKVKKGDHVVLSWLKGSGMDVPSTQYVYKDQVVNSGAISTFMTHAVISENRVIPISKKVPLKEAAMLGCALPTGIGIVLNTIKLRPGDNIAIFGLGGIGMSALMGAQLMHANKIIAVDIHESKLEDAKRLGATHVVNAKSSDPIQEILSITDGIGVDYSIEAAGNKFVMEQAFKVVKNQTGKCVVAGNLKKGEKIEIDPFDLILGKQIIGTWGGESNIEKDVQLYSALLEKNKLNISQLLSDEYSIESIMKAVDDVKLGKVLRALIKC